MPIRRGAIIGTIVASVFGLCLGFFEWLVAAGMAWHGSGPTIGSLFRVLAIAGAIGAAGGAFLGTGIGAVIWLIQRKGM